MDNFGIGTSRLFLSDLHLDERRPHITEIFLQFLKSEYVQTGAELYILGDLFEFWIGDDMGHYPEVLQALGETTSRGINIFFMPGNRDFLVGSGFEKQTGCQIIPDPYVINLDHPVLLMHGDTLCTDDIKYQEFRSKARSQQWQQKILSMTVEDRLQYAQSLRELSQKSIQENTTEIMDVNQHAVEEAMIQYGCQLLVHGHTHRRAVHQFEIDNNPATRIVLGDWYESGNVLLLNTTEDYSFIELNP